MDKEQRHRIRAAYDLTVRDFKAGINPMASVPLRFKKSKAFKSFLKETDPLATGSSAPDIKSFLRPKPGMNCLDAGCCANLATKRFDKWPSIYYGIDISPVLIEEMKSFVEEALISIGGLEVADISDIPYADDFFDIVMVIGVFEYVDLDYSEEALKELHRVMKPGARMVLDIPNPDNPHVETMFRLEEYLKRPNIPKSRRQFERLLESLFSIVKTNDKHVMLKYFVRKR